MSKKQGFFSKNFKKLDMFGVPIQLKYKEEDTYRTNCGAIATVLSYASIVLFIAAKLNSITNKDSQVSDNMTYHDLRDSNHAYILDKTNFDISIYFEWTKYFNKSEIPATNWDLYFSISFILNEV